LANNKIDLEDPEPLIQLFEKMPKLSVLYLNGNNVVDCL